MFIFINESYDDINVFELDKEGGFSYIQKRVAAFRSGIIDLSNTKLKNQQHINFKKNIIISDDDNYHFSDDGNKITIIVDITLYNRLKEIEIKLFPMGGLRPHKNVRNNERPKYTKLENNIKNYFKRTFTYKDGEQSLDDLFNDINRMFYLYEEDLNITVMKDDPNVT